ncbi:MAG: DsbA family protein, partial [Paracoccus sp. (in: a-proteobacteria)]|nr:DsbA family protein [Paracoccus sp. (in: a-proteobacteria)]
MKNLLAALLLSATPAAAFDLGAMTEAERASFGEAVRSYLLDNPEVLIEAMNVLEHRRIADETQADSAAVREFADLIFEDSHSWVGGNPEGDITLVEFVDYRCGVCRQVYEHVFETVEDDGNIRLIMKEFPILGPESVEASRFAIAALQVAGPDAYRDVHDRLFNMRGGVTQQSLRQLAVDAGLDADAVLSRMSAPEVDAALEANSRLGEAMQIAGTPSFVIGDQLLRGVPRAGLVPAIA